MHSLSSKWMNAMNSNSKTCVRAVMTSGEGPREHEKKNYEKELSRSNARWRWLGKVSAYGLAMGNKLVKVVGGCAVPLPPTLPTETITMSPTKETDIMAAMARLDKKKDEWVKIPTDARADMLAACQKRIPDIAQQAAAAAVRHHGSYGGGLGDELITWMPVSEAIVNFEKAMRAGGQPDLPAVSRRRNGQYVVDVFPEGRAALLFGDMKAEVWIRPEEEPTQGLIYRKKQEGSLESSIAAILGAGNQVSLTVLDILHMLLVEDRVVVMKMNEVNAYLGPYVCQALAPFFEQGFVEMIYGGSEEGGLVCNHPATNAIHLTGAAFTFNKILWGSPDPKNQKRLLPEEKVITGELGNVTPFIVVPGNWTDEELTYQAKSILSGLLLNSSHNCLALEIMITSKQWPLREKFLKIIRKLLSSCHQQAAWYPGSKQKFTAFRDRFPNHTIEEYGQEPEAGSLPPWLFVSGLSPSDAEISTENWCGVFQEVCLDVPEDDTEQFLDQAVSFANSCWGSLTCAIFIDPSTQTRHSVAFDVCLENLKFGSIMVNAPTGLAFTATNMSWGAYPGNALDDIGSGNCMMNNTLLLDHPEKSILYCPWRFLPHPFWFYTLANKTKAIEKAINFILNPSVSRTLALLPQVLIATS